jgi:hypothetical protein
MKNFFQHHWTREVIILLTLILPLNLAPKALANEPVSPLVSVLPTSSTLAPKTLIDYGETEKALSPEMYILYRVNERLVRANQIDVPFWQLVLDSNYNVYSEAGGVYTIFWGESFLSLLANDLDAVYFVMAHEMAHYSNDTFGRIRSFSVNLREALFEELGDGSTSNTELTDNPEFTRQFNQFYTSLQVETDLLALDYMARAGANINGALTVLQTLERVEGSDPQYTTRISAIQTVLENDTFHFAKLAAEGRQSLAATEPLPYEIVNGGNAVRVRLQPLDYGASLDAWLEQ